jgi:magnesium transporter
VLAGLIFEGMIRSLAFTTQGRLHTKDIEIFLMPTLLADTNLFLWVDLENPTSEESHRVLESIFHFHPLSIEDCVAVSESPKVEEYTPKEGDRFTPYLFMVIHAVDYSRKDGVFATSELNFFLGKNFLVTYHELPLKSVHMTEERCLRGTGHIARAPDRVAYTLLDGIVDNYKPALEILARFAHGEFKLIRPHLVPYYRDVYDALFHISELAQRYTDSLTGILQVYLNMSANQTGEIIKLLTLITVITTPLTIVGTWYGMNFEGIQEFKWKYGYEMAITITVVATGLTIWWFKKNKWL